MAARGSLFPLDFSFMPADFAAPARHPSSEFPRMSDNFAMEIRAFPRRTPIFYRDFPNFQPSP
jgi:hypothetical protein